MPAGAEASVLVEEALDLYLARYPHRAACLGLDDRDDAFTDWSPAATAAYLERIRPLKARLDHLLHIRQAGEAATEAEQVRDMLARDLFLVHRLGWHRRSPLLAMEDLDPTPYARAADDTRIRARARSIPAIAGMIDATLRECVSAPALQQAAGLCRKMAAGWAASEDGKAAAEALETLARNLAGRSGEERDGVGRECLAELLIEGKAIRHASVETIERMAEAHLNEQTGRAREAAARIAPGAPLAEAVERTRRHPAPAELIGYLEGLLDRARAFSEESGLFTVPPNPGTRVAPSPAALSWTAASMDCPGPFNDPEIPGIFFVTLPEASSEKEREAWLAQFDEPLLAVMAVHEAWPGHYLQSLHWRRAPSRAARIVKDPCFLEGWAHYCEQLALEQGFGGDDPAFALAAARAAMLRCCRLLGFIRFHRDHAEIAQLTRFFVDQAFLPEKAAEGEALRVTFDLDCGNYTLGKLLLLDIRDRSGLGLRAFHDRVLALGVPSLSGLQKALCGR
jgi:uncharacterized protein (DUF885 family)